MSKIKKGSTVTWESHSQSRWSVKRGTVIAFLDAGVHASMKCPKRLWNSLAKRYKMFDRIGGGDKCTRKRYLVEAVGKDGKTRLYTPYASRVVAV